jgi:hypothetical protein
MWFSTLEGRDAPIRTGTSPGGIRPVEGFCLHEIFNVFFSMSRNDYDAAYASVYMDMHNI